MSMRKPFIVPRPVGRDRDERSAEIGAGEQSLVLTVSHHGSLGKAGAKVDLSWAEPDQPLVIACDLTAVAIPTHHFEHKTSRDYFFASECVRTLACIHALFDGQEVNGDTLALVAQVLKQMGLYVREPGGERE